MNPPFQTQAQLDWFERQGITRFDLAVQKRSGAWMAQNPAMDRAALQRLLPWCRSENAHGSNVYFRAHRHGSWPVVFLDDVAAVDAQRIAEAHPALVIETSPDRCHVWIRTDADLDERNRLYSQRQLAAR